MVVQELCCKTIYVDYFRDLQFKNKMPLKVCWEPSDQQQAANISPEVCIDPISKSKCKGMQKLPISDTFS